jgi:hypothetical protein
MCLVHDFCALYYQFTEYLEEGGETPRTLNASRTVRGETGDNGFVTSSKIPHASEFYHIKPQIILSLNTKMRTSR